jgi:hypothetical protein
MISIIQHSGRSKITNSKLPGVRGGGEGEELAWIRVFQGSEYTLIL